MSQSPCRRWSHSGWPRSFFGRTSAITDTIPGEQTGPSDVHFITTAVPLRTEVPQTFTSSPTPSPGERGSLIRRSGSVGGGDLCTLQASVLERRPGGQVVAAAPFSPLLGITAVQQHVHVSQRQRRHDPDPWETHSLPFIGVIIVASVTLITLHWGYPSGSTSVTLVLGIWILVIQ